MKLPGLDITVDDLCDLGLFEYHETRIRCPYVWLLLLCKRSPSNFIRKFIRGHLESIATKFELDDGAYFLPHWQHWEIFNGLFRCLKSLVFDGQTVLYSQFHHGALLNVDPDFQIKVKKLRYVKSSQQINTKEALNLVVKHELGDCRVANCTEYIQNAYAADSGDSFCAIDLHNKTVLEVIQDKLEPLKVLTGTEFIKEREKSANDDDFFLMCSLYKRFDGSLPHNSGLVTAENFESYYGPFSGRAYYMSEKIKFDINLSTRFELESIEGIGHAKADRIMKQRPFKNLELCHQATKIDPKILKAFEWK